MKICTKTQIKRDGSEGLTKLQGEVEFGSPFTSNPTMLVGEHGIVSI